MNVNRVISRAIKEKKWVRIEYKNKKEEIGKYWIGINDIDVKGNMSVVMYNRPRYGDSVSKVVTNSFERIISAEIVEGTIHETKIDINDKILSNIEGYSFLDYDSEHSDILEYYLECVKRDNAPYNTDGVNIRGLDSTKFDNNNEYKLSEKQYSDVLNNLQSNMTKILYKNEYSTEIELVLNELSIQTSRGYYVVAYKSLLLDIENRTLKIDKKLKFNKTFIVNKLNSKESFINRLEEYTSEEFVLEDRKSIIKELVEAIEPNLKEKETFETNPMIFELAIDYNFNYRSEYEYIKELLKENELTNPLKAFFTRIDNRSINKRDNPILLLNNNSNIDQLRVVYNSINNPITFVQGPPGTGKTATILNVVSSCLLNNEKVLISSHNNKPLDDIVNKLKNIEYGNKNITMPILRLGSNRIIPDALLQIYDIYTKSAKLQIYEETLDRKRQIKVNEDKGLKELIKTYDNTLELLEKENAKNKVLEKIGKFDFNLNINIQTEFDVEIKEQEKQKEEIANKIKDLAKPFDDEMQKWLYYKSWSYLKRIREPKYKQLIELAKDLKTALKETKLKEKNDKINSIVKTFNEYIKNKSNFKELLRVFPIIVSTNISSSKLGEPSAYFDLTIIDEAGQCPIASSLVPIIRGERLLLVGDTNQLEPITNIDPTTNAELKEKFLITDNYDYLGNSIIKCMENLNSTALSILLSYHYRCRPEIIGFSNQRYYNNNLNIETKSIDNETIKLINVKTKKTGLKNVSLQEINQVIEVIKNSEYSNDQIGVITPFKLQEAEMQAQLKNNNIKGVEAHTIHKFQGAEKDQIILSLVVNKNMHKNTFNWVKNNRQLLNVGTTRAKEQLTIICDEKAIRKLSKKEDNDLIQLLEYARKKGDYVISNPNEELLVSSVIGAKPFNSKHESKFLDTIEQVLSTATNIKDLKVKDKVKVSEVIELDESLSKYKQYYLKSHFDFVLFDEQGYIKLAIELDGNEHFNDEKVKGRDYVKNTICKKHNIRLLRIPNIYSRRYHLIKEQLVNIFK